ncbi:MAG: methyltransferase domain-containing protein [Candidatus Latescibacteria bacterium]|nr:methyltransferase domain-containing protein [Candidatus Latescibacterota bacterium]NIO56293.1 methyltransferase domain-containing protein [Candidatus Latescibacterota bacterium]
MQSQKRARPFLYISMWLLVILITCVVLTAAWASDDQPAEYETLRGQLEEAYKSGNYETALEIAEEMNTLVETRHYETLYDIACLYSLLGNKVKAYEYLQKAVDAGFWNHRQMRQDKDFENLWEEPRFKKLLRGAWSKGYIAMLEREERDEFQKPEEVMKALELKPGERVADIGAGSGYFTIRVAKAVEPAGKVWATDISDEMLDYIEKRLQSEQLENVELVKVSRDDPQLPASGVDMILMVDTYHYIQELTEYAKKLRAGLAPGGRLVVIDFIPKPWEERPWGPPPQQHLSKETLSADLAKAGFKPAKEYDFLPKQFFIVYGVE